MYWVQEVLVGPLDDPLSLKVLQGCIVIFFTSLLVGEASGNGLRYSKFARTTGLTVPCKVGMGTMYLPSFLLSAAFLFLKLSHSPLLPSPCNPRLLVLATALTLHFLKRFLEVLFLHKFSGSMEVSMSVFVSAAYASACGVLLYAQQVAVEREAPAIDLMRWGVGVFLVGIVGNFYHHYLLATLRSNNNKGPSQKSSSRYKIPQGGLFTWVVCPHYLFESVGFLGITMIAQTSAALIAFVGMSAALCARSYQTKAWYLQKIEGFPADRKPFFPFLF